MENASCMVSNYSEDDGRPMKLILNNVLTSYFWNGLACLHSVSEAGLECNSFSSVADDHFVFFLIMYRNAVVYDYTVATPFCLFNKENMVSYFGRNPLSTYIDK